MAKPVQNHEGKMKAADDQRAEAERRIEAARRRVAVANLKFKAYAAGPQAQK